jgi:hypothetical protein
MTTQESYALSKWSLNKRHPVRSLFLVLSLTVLSSFTASAQISVEVNFDQEQFIASEPLFAVVRIVNFSGRTLSLGTEKDWLRFDVASAGDYIVKKIEDPPVVEPFELPSASRVTRRVNIAPYFEMQRAGRYFVTATVRIPGASEELMSKPKGVNISAGVRMWDQEFGMTTADGTQEVRRWSLLQAMNQRAVRLYVRLADQQDMVVYRIYPIGPLISFTKPEHQIDQDGSLHVLFQTGAKAFTYCRINTEGELSLRRTHEYTETRPSLKVDREGTIKVIGGRRTPSPSDLPSEEKKPTASLSTNELDRASKPSTNEVVALPNAPVTTNSNTVAPTPK